MYNKAENGKAEALIFLDYLSDYITELHEITLFHARSVMN